MTGNVPKNKKYYGDPGSVDEEIMTEKLVCKVAYRILGLSLKRES